MLLLSAASFIFESVYPQLRGTLCVGIYMDSGALSVHRVPALLEVFESDSMTTRPNHALQRTRRERRGCNSRVPCAGSLKLGSLIWLKSVKRTVPLLSENFHFSFDSYSPPAGPGQRQEHFPAVIKAEMR